MVQVLLLTRRRKSMDSPREGAKMPREGTNNAPREGTRPTGAPAEGSRPTTTECGVPLVGRVP